MSKSGLIKLILLTADIVLMYASLFLVLAFRYHDFSVFPGPQTRQFFFHFSFIHLFWLGLLYAFDMYDVFLVKKFSVFLKNLFLFSIFAFAVGAVYFYLNLHSLISPKTILFFDVLLFSVFILLRSLAAAKIVAAVTPAKNIAVAGWCPQMEELARDHFPGLNYKIAAVFRPGALEGFENLNIYTRQNEFIAALKEKQAELVIFAIPAAARPALSDLISKIDIGTKITSLESFYEELTGKISLDLIDNVWMSDIVRRTSRAGYINGKRIFDVIFSIIGLAVTAVLFPFIALAIKLDSPGPVFYVQKRKGKMGKDFDLYKYRTMLATKDQYLVFRADATDQVTRVGRVIKRLHIDEFPQFFNILRGDISFVGPRPEWKKLAEEYEKDIPFYKDRYLVRPGFTGWAQINYKASATAKEAREKFEYDLYYIKNRSFVLDMSIIAKTIQLFFR